MSMIIWWNTECFSSKKVSLKKKKNYLTRNTEILTAADVTGLKKGQEGFF